MRTLTHLLALATTAALPAATAAQQQPILVQQEIQTTVTKMLHAIDGLDW